MLHEAVLIREMFKARGQVVTHATPTAPVFQETCITINCEPQLHFTVSLTGRGDTFVVVRWKEANGSIHGSSRRCTGMSNADFFAYWRRYLTAMGLPAE